MYNKRVEVIYRNIREDNTDLLDSLKVSKI